ncbi:MAG: class I SAM-dependent methyltransferase [Gammaproteobacteria bacterium]
MTTPPLSTARKVHDMRGSERMRRGLQALIELLPSDLVMVEVGSYAGESTAMFLKSGKVRHLTAVDDWDTGANAEPVFDECMRDWLAGGQASKVKALSANAAKQFQDATLDFVYIDADHRYQGVIVDIDAWLPKLKPGCPIAGHDYTHPTLGRKWWGVQQAVNERFGGPDMVFEDSSWLVRDPGPPRRSYRRR